MAFDEMMLTPGLKILISKSGCSSTMLETSSNICSLKASLHRQRKASRSHDFNHYDPAMGMLALPQCMNAGDCKGFLATYPEPS